MGYVYYDASRAFKIMNFEVRVFDSDLVEWISVFSSVQNDDRDTMERHNASLVVRFNVVKLL